MNANELLVQVPKLRLLMVTFDPTTGSGGIEGRTMAYASGLAERSVHVEVAAFSPAHKETEELYFGMRLARLSSAIQELPRAFRALVRIMSGSSLDSVFILSGGATPVGILILFFSHLTGRKSGVFFYGKDLLQSRKTLLRRVALMLTVLLASRIATNSRYTAGLLPFRPRYSLTTIYPGVDTGMTDGVTIGARSRIPRRILFVGRLIQRKGADLLLESFGQLLASDPALKLDIVGDGPELGNLHALASRLGLNKSVTFYGDLYGPNLWKRYAEASIFVMPARQSTDDVEGFGTVFLEAGVFGIPSVGTRTGGIPEAVIDGVTGKLIDSEDISALGKAIQNLLQDPMELERMGRNAQKRASKFTWDASIAHVMDLFKD